MIGCYRLKVVLLDFDISQLVQLLIQMPSNTLPEISFSEDLYDDDSEGSSFSVQIESSLNEFSKRFVIEALGLKKRLSNIGRRHE